jgi:hypothetical protein
MSSGPSRCQIGQHDFAYMCGNTCSKCGARPARTPGVTSSAAMLILTPELAQLLDDLRIWRRHPHESAALDGVKYAYEAWARTEQGKKMGH